MILLLNDEYRVKGLKRLLNLDGDGYLVKQTPTTPAAKMMQMSINQEFLQQHIHLLSSKSHQQLTYIQKRTEKLGEENNSLQKQLNVLKETHVQDIAINARELELVIPIWPQHRYYGCEKAH